MNSINQLNITNIQDSSATFIFNLTNDGIQKLFETGVRAGQHYLGNYYREDNNSFVAFCSSTQPGILQSIPLSELLGLTEVEQVAQAVKIGTVSIKLSPLPLKASTEVAPVSPHAISETDTESTDGTPSLSPTPRSVTSSCASRIPVLRRPSVQSTTSSVAPSKAPSSVVITIETTNVELDLEEHQKQTLKQLKVTSATPCQMNVKNYALDFGIKKGKDMLFLTPLQKQKIQEAVGSFQTKAPVVPAQLF